MKKKNNMKNSWGILRKIKIWEKILIFIRYFFLNFNFSFFCKNFLILKLFQDEQVLKELEKKFLGLKVGDEEKDDSDIDIKVEELLEDLTINDKDEDISQKDGNLDIKPLDKEEIDGELENIDKDKKLIGKRDRKGEKLN